MFGLNSDMTAIVLFVALFVVWLVGTEFAEALKAKYESGDEDTDEDDEEGEDPDFVELLERQNTLLEEQNVLLREIRDTLNSKEV